MNLILFKFVGIENFAIIKFNYKKMNDTKISNFGKKALFTTIGLGEFIFNCKSSKEVKCVNLDQTYHL